MQTGLSRGFSPQINAAPSQRPHRASNAIVGGPRQASNNRVFYLGTNGTIYAFSENQTIVLQANNAVSFAVGASNRVYFLGTD